MSWPELEAQAKGCKELKLLRELEWPIGALWSVTFPAFKTFSVVVAGHVSVIVHHVQHIMLHVHGWLRRLVVRTVDIQVVIDCHLHCVITLKKPEEENTFGHFFDKNTESRIHVYVTWIIRDLQSCNGETTTCKPHLSVQLDSKLYLFIYWFNQLLEIVLWACILKSEHSFRCSVLNSYKCLFHTHIKKTLKWLSKSGSVNCEL